eukprot:TRINITY_DN37410_c0_g1_i1.p1 TRINITY_DN37410_c0_g1~~TRINITY_DN37410_c0_g1_i1.p1  ORF type:complete len:779 (+),score=107.85 TRINITY_DN37410_c0_g1_i1:22-2337(+)
MAAATPAFHCTAAGVAAARTAPRLGPTVLHARQAEAAGLGLALGAVVAVRQVGKTKGRRRCLCALSQRHLARRQRISRRAVPASEPGASRQTRPYGAWESPITAALVTAAGVRLGALSCDSDARLHWLEGRPQEGGRQVVCRYEPENASASERSGLDVLPDDHNARTRVHEYGGGAYILGPDGDGVIYSNFKDQRLYWQKADGSSLPLTPQEEGSNPTFRFADACLDLKRNRLICVREDHTNPEPAKVENTICAVALDGSLGMEVLIYGQDFYAAPRISPDGRKLAFITWDHPHMPWDDTELRVANLNDAGRVTVLETICGGNGQGTSVLQPAWSPDDGVLHFVADTLGWWNLYKCNGWNSEEATSCLTSHFEEDFSGPAPGWSLGQQNFCFLEDGRVATCYRDIVTGGSRIVLIGKDGSTESFGQECLPAVVGGLCPCPDGKLLYFLGGSPDTPSGIYRWRIPKAGEKADGAEMIVCSTRKELQADPAFLSRPESVEFPTGDGEVAHGYYYAPNNPGFVAPEGSRPPLLVKAHGGPTACTGTSLSLGMQFWTSRGFAVLDVDYRGSTGYGRAYRNRLKGNWGICDVEDVCAGAEHLVKQGLVDPKKLAIDGGSAGGFTTLAALAFRDVFTAGCSLYGVADLAVLAGDTHKFESRYLDRLVGKYPEDKETYEARAPICHVEKFACPILLLQGAEDKIVPPNQAELMYEAVKSRGLPCALKVYEGEQHGFRRSENIQDALNSELSFYGSIFGFEPAGEDIPALEIANFEGKS